MSNDTVMIRPRKDTYGRVFNLESRGKKWPCIRVYEGG